MIQSMELEELEAYLDQALPQGFLNKEPSSPKKKLQEVVSVLQKNSIRCPRNVREACEASKYPTTR